MTIRESQPTESPRRPANASRGPETGGSEPAPHTGGGRRARRLRAVLAVSALLIAALIGARLYLPTAVRNHLNGILERNGAYTGHVAEVDLALWRGSGEIRGLEIVKRNGEVPVPFLELARASGSLQWSALLRHGELVLDADVEAPALHLVAAPSEEEQQFGEGGRWQETVEALMPIRVDRISVREGRLHFHDFHSDPKVDVLLSDISLDARNLTNIRDPEKPLPAHARLTATPMTAGQLIVTADLDPLARLPRFDVDAELRDMELEPWNSLLRAYGGFDVERGSIAVYAELEAGEGRFEGYLKPFVLGLDVLDVEAEKDEKNVFQLAWEAAVGATAEIFQNQPTEQLATRVPLSGTVENPETEFWPTFVNVLRNAFVEAFAQRLESSG